MTAPRFPAVIDNSIRKDLVRCQKLAHWKHEMGYQESAENEHIIAGGAFAAGLEIARKEFYVMNHSEAQAVQAGVQTVYAYPAYKTFRAPAGSNKSQDRVAGAIAYYFQEYPLATDKLKPLRLNDGSLAIECSFQFEIPITHPDIDKPLIYCGRYDMLAEDENGDVWVNDEKTTGSLGPKWAAQWELDAQMSGYCYAANKMLEAQGDTRRVKGANIRGVSFLKGGYETVQVPAMRQQWELDRWYDQVLKDFTEWAYAYKNQDHNQILDHGCALYNNPCSHSRLCKSRNPERLIDGNYTIRFWNPLARDES